MIIVGRIPKTRLYASSLSKYLLIFIPPVLPFFKASTLEKAEDYLQTTYIIPSKGISHNILYVTSLINQLFFQDYELEMANKLHQAVLTLFEARTAW